MRILVAGGAGFIGSHLCERLLERGEEILCLDSFYTGSMNNIGVFLPNPRFQLLKQDVIAEATAEIEGVDAVINLACPAAPDHYQRNPIHTLETSFLGTRQLLRVAAKQGIPLLHSSTSEIYGEPLQHPQREDYWGNVNPIGVRACYDEGKRAAETLLTDHRRSYGTDTRIVRIFNTYGPHMQHNDGRVVSNFVLQALRNDPLTVYGTGEQTRSFCYVADLVEGLERMLDVRGFPGPVNLGNPEESTLIQLAEQIRELSGSRSPLRLLPAREDDPTHRCPDIRLARERLGWNPSISLREGLQKTITYFQKQLSSSAQAS